jgi:uncharacterized membrane protein
MLLLALLYPLLVHIAVLWPYPWLEWLALAVLAALVLFPHLQARRLWSWCALGLALTASAWLVVNGRAQWLLVLPPIAVPLSLLLVFGSTLRAGQMPLITRIATLVHGTLPEDLARYTRSLTIFWAVLFALLTLSATGLALFASRATWSLATNFVHYLLIGVIFLLEYIYRRWRFSHHSHPSFSAYLRLLTPSRLRTP